VFVIARTTRSSTGRENLAVTEECVAWRAGFATRATLSSSAAYQRSVPELSSHQEGFPGGLPGSLSERIRPSCSLRVREETLRESDSTGK